MAAQPAGKKSYWKAIPKNDEDIKLPIRKSKTERGTAGKPITLFSNHFEVKVRDENVRIFHYNVTIKDFRGIEALPKKKKMAVFEQMKKSYPKVFDVAPFSFDSEKNGYSTHLYAQVAASAPASKGKGKKKGGNGGNGNGAAKKAVTYDVELPLEGSKNKSKYTVTLEKVNEAVIGDFLKCLKYIINKTVDIPATTVQMMEVMFRHYRSLKYEQVGMRSFFDLNDKFAAPHPLGGGKMGMAGFFASIRPSCWKDGSILLNIDTAHTAFYKAQPVLDFLEDQGIRFDVNNTFGPIEVKRANKALRNLRIRTTHVERKYKFNKLHPESAKKTKFPLEKDGKKQMVSVEAYFASQYKCKLKFPNMNCLHLGNPEKNIFVPIECCRIEKGQRVTKKLSDKEVADFIKMTAVPPAQRLDRIKRIVKDNQFNADPMLQAMTFTISEQPLQTQGRVLPVPALQMNRSVTPRNGVWDVRGFQFYRAAAVNCWAVIDYYGTRGRGPQTDAMNFVQKLMSLGENMGMKFAKPVKMIPYDNKRGTPKDDLDGLKKAYPQIQFVLCMISGKNHYGSIKVAGDTQVKLITQCVLAKNVEKCQDQTIGNLLQKINAKLDGTNNIIQGDIARFGPQGQNIYLVMGADVNHPPAGGSEQIPSVSAVVGSIDLSATRYAIERRINFHRQEIISDFFTIMKNLLIAFYKNNKRKPNRIIMYRDGVSESQFMQVLAGEMKQMRRACTDLEAGYEPGITFICVQKRHHTRLFVANQQEGVGKSGNIPPGTIVDKDITHPTETDFFLCSHQGIQGTSRPTHYHLLWDDNDIPIDELQQMTYRLCHVYSRCARSVSIPAPVYYAHLAAFRAKVYISEIIGDDDSSNGSVAGFKPTTEQEKRAAAKRDEEIANIRTQIDELSTIHFKDALGTKLHYI